MKNQHRTMLISLAICAFGIVPATAASPVAQFNVGMRIVDPCVMKGQKWEKQCAQLKKQRQQQPKPKAKKPYKKQIKSDFPG